MQRVSGGAMRDDREVRPVQLSWKHKSGGGSDGGGGGETTVKCPVAVLPSPPMCVEVSGWSICRVR